MKRKKINGLLLLAIALLVQQVTMAQPPPPHPGGSGNQGAPLYGLALLAAAGVALGSKKLKQ